MEEKLNNKYESVLDFLYYVSSSLCREYNIEITIDILPPLELNAYVYQDSTEDNKYHIKLYFYFGYRYLLSFNCLMINRLIRLLKIQKEHIGYLFI